MAALLACSTAALAQTAAGSGSILTIAGQDSANFGYSGDGAAAINARLNQPYGLAFGPTGDVFIADLANSAIRRIDLSTQNIFTVAGGNGAGLTGNGGPATSAQINTVFGVAVDPVRNILYISDYGECVLRQVNLTTGIINHFAGQGFAGFGFGGDGGPAATAQITTPIGIAVDSAGNVSFADNFNDRIRQVNISTRIINTVAGNGGSAAPDNVPATASGAYNPFTVSIDRAGDLFFHV